MDSRDSSSTTAANRDGPSTEDDGALSVTSALAKDAANYFQSGKYAECVDVLNQLKQKKEDDPKVLHNLAIAECFRDGCLNPKKLLEVLNSVKKRSEELARTSGEQVDSVNNAGSKVPSISKGNSGITHQFAAANCTRIIYSDEFDTSVATLNIAVVWFHLHEYGKALSILEPLFQNIEPIDETTALRICLLLLDVVLACHDESKFADVLNYLEKAFGVGSSSQGESSNMCSQQSANLVKLSSASSSSLAADASTSDLAASVNASENPLSRTLSEDPLDEMFTSLDISVHNLDKQATLSSANDLPRSTVDRSVANVDLKLKLQLYKVQFLLLTRNLKLAKREVKHAMNIARGKESSLGLLLKSQLEYARGNHRKAIKLLMASGNLTEAGISSMFNNNLGCIFYQLGKYHTSAVFFSKALSSRSVVQKDRSLKLSTFSLDKSLHITYNCGLQYLACGKPVLAARCFQKASLVFYKRPLLWLRLAECCLMALQKGLIQAGLETPDRSDIGVRVIGKGKWRHLVVENGISGNGVVDSSVMDRAGLGGDGQIKLSLPFARQCLYNAMHLSDCFDSSCSRFAPPNSPLEENNANEAASLKNSNPKNLASSDSKTSTTPVGQVSSNGEAKEQKGGMTQEIIQNSMSYYNEICRRENQMIKQALLADLAFVELELENPVKALSNASSLLDLPDCSRIYTFLAHVYAAEALCMLNKPKEAAEHLSMYLSRENNVELPFGQEDYEQWSVEKAVDCEESNVGSATAKTLPPIDSENFMFLKPEEARGILYADLAVMFAVQGELERAHHFVTQALSLTPNRSEAMLTAIYVDLMLGKSQDALAKLKQSSQVRFLPGSLRLSKSS